VSTTRWPSGFRIHVALVARSAGRLAASRARPAKTKSTDDASNGRQRSSPATTSFESKEIGGYGVAALFLAARPALQMAQHAARGHHALGRGLRHRWGGRRGRGRARPVLAGDGLVGDFASSTVRPSSVSSGSPSTTPQMRRSTRGRGGHRR